MKQAGHNGYNRHQQYATTLILLGRRKIKRPLPLIFRRLLLGRLLVGIKFDRLDRALGSMVFGGIGDKEALFVMYHVANPAGCESSNLLLLFHSN